MKTSKRSYNVKVISGQIFKNAEIFTARKDINFFNSIREQAEEKYSGPNQFVKIDHVSRVITVNY